MDLKKSKERTQLPFKLISWMLEGTIMIWIRVLLPFKACQAQCFSAPVPFFPLSGRALKLVELSVGELCCGWQLQTHSLQSVTGRDLQRVNAVFLKCEENKTPL